MASLFANRFVENGSPVSGFAGTGTFAERATLPVQAAIKIDDDVPFEVASLIGCGVTTGVGAVLNTARIEAGSSVAVFGCGGVGLSAIQGARIGGARMIIAVDTVESKLAYAKEMGATHVLVLASTPEDGAAACERGATMWVLRPCDTQQLVAAVRSILEEK